jgi:hypothetical protein
MEITFNEKLQAPARSSALNSQALGKYPSSETVQAFRVVAGRLADNVPDFGPTKPLQAKIREVLMGDLARIEGLHERPTAPVGRLNMELGLIPQSTQAMLTQPRREVHEVSVTSELPLHNPQLNPPVLSSDIAVKDKGVLNNADQNVHSLAAAPSTGAPLHSPQLNPPVLSSDIAVKDKGVLNNADQNVHSLAAAPSTGAPLRGSDSLASANLNTLPSPSAPVGAASVNFSSSVVGSGSQPALLAAALSAQIIDQAQLGQSEFKITFTDKAIGVREVFVTISNHRVDVAVVADNLPQATVALAAADLKVALEQKLQGLRADVQFRSFEDESDPRHKGSGDQPPSDESGY